MPYKIAFLIVLLVLGGVWGLNYTKGVSTMDYQVYYHQNGQAFKIENDKAKEVQTFLSACLPQTNDRLRLLLDKEGMQKIFEEGEAWEIVYDEDQECTFGSYGLEVYRKVIVPVKGYLSPLPGATKMIFITESPKGNWAVWGCEGVSPPHNSD